MFLTNGSLNMLPLSGETEILLNYICHGKLPMLHGGGIAAHGEA